MRHFRLALIVTPIALFICLMAGIGCAFWIQGSGGNVEGRAEMLGQGMGILTMLVVAPFWIHGAYKFRNERRESQNSPRPKTPPRRKPAS